MEEFINLEKQEKLSRLTFFNDLEKVEKMFEEYKEAFSKIGINTETIIGTNRDVIEVLTEMARQLYTIQLKLYDLERDTI